MTTLFRDSIRQSWVIAWRYKYLWLFGFFAALLGNGGELQVLLNNVINIGESPQTLLGIQNLYTTGFLGIMYVNFKSFLSQSTLEAIFFLLVFLTTTFVAIWLIVTSQGALFDGIKKIQNGKKTDLAQGYRAGSKFFGRILALNVISNAVVYGLFIAVSLPIVLVLLVKSTDTGILLYVLFGFIILVPIALVISFVSKYAILYVVWMEQSLGRAISSGWHLFKRNVLVTVEASLIILGFSILGALALIIVLAFLSIPFFMLGFLSILFDSTLAFTVVLVIGFIVIGVAVGIYGAMFSVYRYAFWALIFSRLVDNKGESKILRVIGQAAQYFGKP